MGLALHCSDVMNIRLTRLVLYLAFVLTAAAAEPFALHPANPHYFVYRGKPTVLVTSAEHYGAVINGRFDYVVYLDELRRHGLNNTRIWVGPYREVPGSFDIANNTLAPVPAHFTAPWVRSTTPGSTDGLNKFDLDKWNDAFFARLKAFLREADKRGVIVEVNLFCPYYKDDMWEVSPLNAKNNVNGVGDVPRTDVLTLKHPSLVAVQEKLVRKIVSEIQEFDNFYFEICNEPYFGGVTLDWQERIASILTDAERSSGRRHLISQNWANGSKRIDKPSDLVSIFNFHYSRPAESVAMNYHLNRPIGNNETGFDGTADATYRVQGWEYLMAGGALYNNLDYSFTVGQEKGTFAYTPETPGGGTTALRTQLGTLLRFFDSMPFVEMAPTSELVKSPVPEGTLIRALVKNGAEYAIYAHHGREVKTAKPKYSVDPAERTLRLELDLPRGTYEVLWLIPATGKRHRSRLVHAGGGLTMTSPAYREDLALRLHRTK